MLHIFQATTDLLVDGRGLTPVTIAVRRPFLATKLQVAKLSLRLPVLGLQGCSLLSSCPVWGPGVAAFSTMHGPHGPGPGHLDTGALEGDHAGAAPFAAVLARAVLQCRGRRQGGQGLPCVCAQIAGLDVGWGQQIDMDYDARTHRYVVTRSLPPGRYPFKFIMDGHWTYSADHPTFTVRA